MALPSNHIAKSITESKEAVCRSVYGHNVFLWKNSICPINPRRSGRKTDLESNTLYREAYIDASAFWKEITVVGTFDKLWNSSPPQTFVEVRGGERFSILSGSLEENVYVSKEVTSLTKISRVSSPGGHHAPSYASSNQPHRKCHPTRQKSAPRMSEPET
jgi:hypothetical protein